MRPCQRALRPLLILAALAFLSLPAAAYEFYNGSNNCVQCHNGFVDGFGSPLHDFHNEFVESCSTCHESIGDNPPIENCATCHFPNPLWNAHNSAPTDGNGFSCSTCHVFVGNDARSWGETKAFFR